MPSENILKHKKQIVNNLKDKLNSAVAGVVVDYKGINVIEDTKLRAEMRAAGVDYFVIKNTLLRFAIAETGLQTLGNILEGTTAVAISESDPVVAAKILCKYSDSLKDKFNIKAGFVDGKVVDVKGVEELSKLPPREVLVAQVLGGLNAPITGLVNVLNGNIRGLAVVLKEIAEKKSA